MGRERTTTDQIVAEVRSEVDALEALHGGLEGAGGLDRGGVLGHVVLQHLAKCKHCTNELSNSLPRGRNEEMKKTGVGILHCRS
jgi:hypothetical protein